MMKGNRRIVLAPLVKVTPDTLENKELRTRQRYAVVAGLIESGYRPQEPGLLHFCSIQKDSPSMTCAGSIIGTSPKAAPKAAK